MTAKIRNITRADTAAASDRGNVVMILNGQAVHDVPRPTGPIDEAEVVKLAELVTGSARTAEDWMERPNPQLNRRTPRQAVQDGHGQDAADILRGFMSL